MKHFNFSVILLSSLVLLAAGAANAEVMDRPTGIKIGQRMTLRPYVSMSATYDSNVGAKHDDVEGDVLWTISPTLALDYKGDNSALLLNVFYSYHSYTKRHNTDDYNQHSYGETLRWNWQNSLKNEKGWGLVLSETFRAVSMADDMSTSEGRSYTADYRQFSAQGGLERRFTDRVHADIDLNYYMIKYDNDTSASSAYYGYQRWSGALQGGYAASPWTDLLLSLGYQGYQQDNTSYGMSNQSQGYTAMAGMGSRATQRISYRAMVGWTRFEYSNNISATDGLSYSISGNWKISDTLTTMLLASSYYQPSERQQSYHTRVDSVSWGLGKSMVRGKLNSTLDLTYRREQQSSISQSYGSDYNLDVVSARLSFNYTINRFIAAFVSGEYQRSWNSEGDNQSGYGDYDRWRATLGFRLTY